MNSRCIMYEHSVYNVLTTQVEERSAAAEQRCQGEAAKDDTRAHEGCGDDTETVHTSTSVRGHIPDPL